jgi:antagonist of KipI
MRHRISKYQQFRVISPGLFTTVQDRGRFGFQKYGVPVTGCLDTFSANIANILVGNSEDAAVLEFTLEGPRLAVLEDALVAITGAEMEVKLNGKEISRWQTIRVRHGDILEIGRAHSGCRGYLAVTAGIDVPLVMGSRSTYIGAAIGGHHGRLLQNGDIIFRGIGRLLAHSRKLPTELVPTYSNEIVLRALPGPQDDFFSEGLERFFNSEYKVSTEANRMGYRLEGPVVEQIEGKPKSIISESSLPGGVQIPPNGQPIILLVEQTVGGYTKIASIISSDLHLVAQALPGDTIRFERVNLETAYGIKKSCCSVYDDLKSVIEKIGQLKPILQRRSNTQGDVALQKYKELYPEC